MECQKGSLPAIAPIGITTSLLFKNALANREFNWLVT
jgi:hypothetical protein